MKTLFIFTLLAIGFLAVYAGDSSEEEANVDVPTNNKESSESSEETNEKKDVKPWRKHDFKRREPEFLADMESAAKTEFSDIKFNKDLTKSQKTQQLKDWAEKYDKEEEMQKFLDAKKADCDKKKQERKDNYERLGDLIEKADAIMDDEESTWSSVNKKIEAMLANENRDVSRAFYSFYPWIGEKEGGRGKHGHGHRFHHGKRFSGKTRAARNIGHGAAPKHHGIGHGAEPPRLDYGNANMNYDPYGRNNNEHKHHKHHHGF